MSHPLAIFTGLVGARTETFIGRHVVDLLPGGTVVVTRKRRDEVPVDWAPSGPVLECDSDDTRIVRAFLRRHGVQSLMGEYLDESIWLLDAARDLGIRFFGHAHGYDVSELLRGSSWRLEYLRYSGATGVITMSQASRQRLIEIGLPPERVHSVPYGIDVPEEPPHRAPRDEVKCLAVGRLVRKKSPLILLDAFRRALGRHPRLTLDLVGDGPLREEVRRYVAANDLDGKVRLCGSLPNRIVRERMREADIFLHHAMTDPLTGDEEGLPVAILEAMGSALPVVSTFHAGIPEAVQHGTTGFLCEEGDAAATARYLGLLAGDSGLRARAGVAGWERARELFSWQRERTALLRLLELGG